MINLRSLLSVQIVGQLLSSVRYGVPFKKSNLYRGYSLYKNTPPPYKKSIIKVLIELSKLTHYWKAFPDTYFRFGMFLKEYNENRKTLCFPLTYPRFFLHSKLLFRFQT